MIALRKFVLIATLAAVVVLTLGCISPPEKTESTNLTDKSAGITTLRIGYQPSTHQIAEMVASEMGWWAEDLSPFGITEIKEFEFPTGVPEMQAMVAGELDIAYVGTAPPISAISAGLPAKIVAAVNIKGSDLVVRPDLAYSGPESLEGLSIGTFPPGSIQDTVMKKWLTDNGVEVSEVDIKAMDPGPAMSALSAGRIDGIFLPHPSPSIVELNGKGKVVVASGEMWPDHACCSLVVTDKLIREQPELVEQIIKTHIKATEYINSHPKEAAEIYSRKTNANITEIEHSIENWDGEWVSDPNLQIPSTVEYAKVDYEMKYTQRELTEKDLFDTSFYERVS
ncbi:MAG: ABC transporter substrate-binding protein [Methanothrix soehngenii]|nr:ABC transporter substrate-binding protein [Methanothrix soehngenii]MDD4488689.1 ABC transporter substrate-binding protein [Methanothrix soehngenii]